MVTAVRQVQIFLYFVTISKSQSLPIRAFFMDKAPVIAIMRTKGTSLRRPATWRNFFNMDNIVTTVKFDGEELEVKSSNINMKKYDKNEVLAAVQDISVYDNLIEKFGNALYDGSKLKMHIENLTKDYFYTCEYKGDIE